MNAFYRYAFFITVFSGLMTSCISSSSDENTTELIDITHTPVSFVTQMATSENIALSPFDFTCWPIKPFNEADTIKGSFIYAHFDSSDRSEVSSVFAWDISSLRSMEITLETSQLKSLIANGSISPDGKTVSVISGATLLLIDEDSVQSFPLQYNDISIEKYLSDGRIFLVSEDLKADRKDSFINNEGITDTYYIFDPVTGETTKHTVYLPNFEMGRRESISIKYSPDLRYVLYRSKHDVDESGYFVDQFTLLDLEQKEILWVGPSLGTDLVNIGVPGWRPNTNDLTALYFISNTDNTNYYSISLDGKVSLLTNFDEIFSSLSSVSMAVWAPSPNWSPNGRYLISKGQTKDDYIALGHGTYLYIWDSQDNVGYKPCLPDERKNILPTPLIWSFDESYVVVSLVFAPSPTPTNVPSPGYVEERYFLDLINKVIYEFPDKDSRGEFFTRYGSGENVFLGWVDWAIP